MATPGVPTRWALLVRDVNTHLRVANVVIATPEIAASRNGGAWNQAEYPLGSGQMRAVEQLLEDPHDPANGIRARAGLGMRYRPATNEFTDPPPRLRTAEQKEQLAIRRAVALIEQQAGLPPIPDEE